MPSLPCNFDVVSCRLLRWRIQIYSKPLRKVFQPGTDGWTSIQTSC